MRFRELAPGDDSWVAALAATPHDIYQLPGFVELEAGRIGGRPAAALVQWSTGGLLVPYLVREVSGAPGVQDVCSPYGYPGALFYGQGDEETKRLSVTYLLRALRELGYCSLFLRLHPILRDSGASFPADVVHVTGETVIADLSKPLDELWHDVRKSNRHQAARLAKEGFDARFERPEAALEDFYAIYLETMDRVGATSEYYSFDFEYLTKLAALLGQGVTICTVRRGQAVMSAKLFTEASGIVQNFLGGTHTFALHSQPSVLEMTEAIRHYKSAGASVLNLGGGLGGQHDSLFHFKAGFSSETREFKTVRVILDEVRYSELATDRARHFGLDLAELTMTKYFPLYRAPETSHQPTAANAHFQLH